MAARENSVEEGGQPAPATKRIKLPPVGFWSYARQDDYLSQGKLNSLRSLLLFELQQIYGRDEIRLFQDTTTIPHGAAWESEIRTALDQSTFFVAIITPNFIQSEWCCREVALFCEREAELRNAHPDLDGRSRILPIHYIDITDIDAADPGILSFLQQLQWFDFRALRNRSFESEPAREAIAELAKGMRSLLNLRVEDPTVTRNTEAQAAELREEEARRRKQAARAEEAARLLAIQEKAAAERAQLVAAVLEPERRSADHATPTLSRLAATERGRWPAVLAAFAGMALLGFAYLFWPRSVAMRPAQDNQSAVRPSTLDSSSVRENMETSRDAFGWLSGRWGVDGDCRDVVTFSRIGDSLSITYGGRLRSERILNLNAPEPNLVVTDRARYANAGGRRVNVSEAGEVTRMDYFLSPCASR